MLFIAMRFVDGPTCARSCARRGRWSPSARRARRAGRRGARRRPRPRPRPPRRQAGERPARRRRPRVPHGLRPDEALGDAGDGVSRAGGWVGTLGYVAPEQIRGGRVDARTDVYALGCLLVFALTGKAPYVGESDEATLWAHLNAPPPSESVPPEFEGVVARALAKDPSDRYPSAGDLGRAALAAAGRSSASRPERNVARGAAAPPGCRRPRPPRGSPRRRGTHISPGDDGPTAASRGGGAVGALAAITGHPRIAAGAAAALVALVLAIVVLGGGDGGDGTATQAGRPRPRRPPPWRRSSARRSSASGGGPTR